MPLRFITGRAGRTPAAIGVAAVSILATVFDFLMPADLTVTVFGIVAIVAAAGLRDRRLVWVLTFVLIALDIAGGWYGPPPPDGRFATALVNRGFIALVMIAVATLVDGWIASQEALVKSRALARAHAEAAEASNLEIAAREEEVARQNEELQSQSEELERQSEELRITNDELGARERMLARLLTLSRGLTTELAADDVMRAVCDSLSDLLAGVQHAAAVLVRQGAVMRVKCHVGFDGGPRSDVIPYESSFASLLMTRAQPGFLEDIGVRPDLCILQPPNGEFRAVLGAPLFSRGQAIGSLEVYAHAPGRWTEEQMNLVASLAAQTSLSLETARLFADVTGERQRFETVFETLPVCVLVANDAECRNVSGNAAAAALFRAPRDANFSPHAPAPERVRRTVLREGRPLAVEEFPLIRAVRNGEVLIGEEYELVPVGGSRVTILVSAAPFFDAEGRVWGGVCAFSDITAQKALGRELDARRREADEANLRKTRFLAAVSHDIRTPANAIRLQAELIKRSADTPALVAKIPDLAQQLQSNAVALVDLVGEVLDLTRFDSGKVELQETEFSLGESIAEECRQLTPIARDKGLSLDCEHVTPPLWLRTDRIKLGRVLGNLMENAIKFTERGEVRVSARVVDGGPVQIQVRDTGVGIAPEHQSRIFDEFFQLRNPARDGSKGRGLGLAICKRLVDAMGGTIELTSTQGEGSTFTVTLPPSVVVATPAAVERALAKSPADEPRGLDAVRILLVEDHDDTREATLEILRAEGAVMDTAADGASALRVLMSFAPDLVVLDLMLPDMDGVEVLKRIRSAAPDARRPRVVVLSGDSANRRGDEIASLGAAAVISKPCEPDALVGRLREVLAS